MSRKKWTMAEIRITDVNRNVVPTQVERLTESIKKNGYFEGMPIMVNPDGLIVDGQHRFLACKNLGIEAPIVEVKNFDIVPILNSTQMRWSMKDYIKYYSAKGYPDYIILESLCKARDVSPNVAYSIINGRNINRQGLAQVHKNDIKDGSFTIPDKSEKGLKKIDRKVEAVMRIIQMLDLPKTDRLCIAITRLANDSNFSFKVMEKKIAYQKARVYRCSTIQEYMNMLAGIYNNKNMKKIVV